MSARLQPEALDSPHTAQALDDVIAQLLRTHEFTAEEIFCIDATTPLERAQRALMVAKVRATLADALHHPTPANLEAAGRACAWLCHLAMAGAADDFINDMGGE